MTARAAARRGTQRVPPDTGLLFDVFALNQAVGRLLDETMRDAPLTPSDYAVSSAIFELGEASPTRIAGRLGMRLTTFMDRLRELERRGYARRDPDPADGRASRVSLTPDGLAAHGAANHAFEAAYEAFERALGAEREAARAALRAMRSAAEAAIAGRATPPSGGRAG